MIKRKAPKDYADWAGILIIEDEKIQDCNDHFLDILECDSKREVVGSRLSDFALEEQLDNKKISDVYSEIIHATKSQGKWKGELQLRSFNGQHKRVEARFVASQPKGGKIAGIIYDITHKVSEEDELNDQNPFYNDYIPMLIINSENGKIFDANSSACHYYGFPKEEITQKKISDINILSESEVAKEMKQAEEEKRNYFLFKHKLSDGQIRDVEVHSWPVTVQGKRMLFSVIQDLRERNEYIDKFKIQESYFKDLFENSPEAIVMADNKLTILDVNKSFEEIFLYKKDEIVGKNIKNTLCDEAYYCESKYFQDSINKGEFIRKETMRKRKDGKLINVSLIGSPITFKDKQIGIYCIYSDLSQIKEEERRKKLFSEVFKNNSVGVVITTSEGIIQWVNKAFIQITGYTASQAEGKKTNILKSGKHNNEFYNTMWSHIINEGKWQGEIRSKRKNGELFQEWLNIIAVKDDKGHIEYLIGMISDITDAKQKEKKIEILTSKDHLTNLYNRDFFNNKLNYLLRMNQIHSKMGVLFLDIDDFKEINDNLGHLVGDLILKEFAARLRTVIREEDIAARFGGDEFIILLTKINYDSEIMNIAKRISKEISGSYKIENQVLHITASMGIAKYPEDGVDSTTLIRNADIAMYQAKESKDHKITLFKSTLNKEVIEHFQLKNNLRQAALDEDFFLNYQPIFDAREGVVEGIEALLRCKANNGDLIPPSKFIPIAEKNGMIVSIGEWVLKTACRQNKNWQNKGYKKVYISVNVSILQLEQPNFCDRVKTILENIKLEPEFLQLEITETIFTKKQEIIVETIQKLTCMGIKIAIDDFGTGYSSLSQLLKLDISKLKIDQSFIGSLHTNSNMRKIVKTIISMAESLNLELVAEGVETIEQLNFLKKNRCNMIQGYLLSRPKDSSSIDRYLGIGFKGGG